MFVVFAVVGLMVFANPRIFEDEAGRRVWQTPIFYARFVLPDARGIPLPAPAAQSPRSFSAPERSADRNPTKIKKVFHRRPVVLI